MVTIELICDILEPPLAGRSGTIPSNEMVYEDGVTEMFYEGGTTPMLYG